MFIPSPKLSCVYRLQPIANYCNHNVFLTKSQLPFASFEHNPNWTTAPAFGWSTYKQVPVAKL